MSADRFNSEEGKEEKKTEAEGKEEKKAEKKEVEGKEEKKELPVDLEKSIVLNLILLGTNSHRYMPGTKGILTQLYSAIAASSQQLAWLIDGPGGEPPKSAPKDHPMLGTYLISVNYDALKGELDVTKTPRHLLDSATRVGGIVSATGYRDSINEAIQIVTAIVHAKKVPLTLNMYGYSRGADAALRISNKLQVKFGSSMIKVNILAIDPVPGIGRKKAKSARMIPDIVQEYHGVLMANETGVFLEPQDMSRVIVQTPARTKVHYSILAGKHASAVRFYSDPKQPRESPFILWHILHRFAERNGTIFKEGRVPGLKVVRGKPNHEFKEFPVWNLPDHQLLRFYTVMADSLHSTSASRYFMDKLQHQKRDYLLHGENYFADKHHQELFKKIYPAYFDYFFQKNAEGATKEQVLADIAKIKKDEVIFDSLKNANYHLYRILSAPMGTYLIARNQYLENLPLVTDELSHLIYAINTSANIMIHTESSYAIRAQLIRLEMFNILNGDYLKGESLSPDDFETHCIHKLKSLLYMQLSKLRKDLSAEAIRFATRLQGIIDSGEEIGIDAMQALKLCSIALNEQKVPEDDALRRMIKETHHTLRTYLHQKEKHLGQKKEMITYKMERFFEDVKSNTSLAHKEKIISQIGYFAGARQLSEPTFANYMFTELRRFKQLDSEDNFNNACANLAKKIRHVLHELYKHKYGNHGELLKIVINTSLLAVSRLGNRYVSRGMPINKELDIKLRELQSVLVAYKSSPIKGPEAATILNDFLQQLSIPPIALPPMRFTIEDGVKDLEIKSEERRLTSPKK